MRLAYIVAVYPTETVINLVLIDDPEYTALIVLYYQVYNSPVANCRYGSHRYRRCLGVQYENRRLLNEFEKLFGKLEN